MANPFDDKSRTSRRNLLRGSILSGASLLFTLAGASRQARANDQYYRRLFFQNGYGYCDARKLAKVLRVSPWQAKAIGGQKIAAGQTGLLRRQWARGVRIFQQYGFRCGTSSSEDARRYAYADADRIARAWTDISR